MPEEVHNQVDPIVLILIHIILERISISSVIFQHLIGKRAVNQLLIPENHQNIGALHTSRQQKHRVIDEEAAMERESLMPVLLVLDSEK